MLELQANYKLFSDGETSDARLREISSGLEVFGVQHHASLGTIHTVGMRWPTEGVDIRSYVAEAHEVLNRFPASRIQIAANHLPWEKDRKLPRPREYVVEGAFTYAEIRRVFGGRKPSWLNFMNHGSIDLFWENKLPNFAESLAVLLPSDDEVMLEHCMDLLARTTRFRGVLTEAVCLEMLEGSRALLENSLASLAIESA